MWKSFALAVTCFLVFSIESPAQPPNPPAGNDVQFIQVLLQSAQDPTKRLQARLSDIDALGYVPTKVKEDLQSLKAAFQNLLTDPRVREYEKTVFLSQVMKSLTRVGAPLGSELVPVVLQYKGLDRILDDDIENARQKLQTALPAPKPADPQKPAGQLGVADLIKGLDATKVGGNDDPKRIEYSNALGNVAKDALTALETLTGIFSKSTNPQVQLAAARAADKIIQAAILAKAPALTKDRTQGYVAALLLIAAAKDATGTDNDVEVRILAFRLMGDLGKEIPSVPLALLAAQNDANKDVAAIATSAFAKIKAATAPAAPAGGAKPNP